jgi:hypothetical protein
LTIILLLIGIGLPAGSDRFTKFKIFSDPPSDEIYSEEEGSAIDLLGSEDIDSNQDGENQQSGGMEDSESEFAGVILEIADNFDGGYANLEWKKFLYIEAGNGYSPAQAEASPVYFDLKLDLGEGRFSGSASGNLAGQEFLHKEKGNFSITDIIGKLTENPQGPGYVLEGKGTLYCEIEMEETYTDGAGKSYTYNKFGTFSEQVDITGKLMLFNSDWELNLRGHLDNGTQSFNLNCRDCPVGTFGQ